jgi:hypothetical protein
MPISAFPIPTKTLATAKSEMLVGLELENVDNTSDASKPVSTAQATTLAPKASPTFTGTATFDAVTITGTLTAKIGSTSGLPLKTGTAGAIEAGAFGTASGTFCQGNDSRLLLNVKSDIAQAGDGVGGAVCIPIANFVGVSESDYVILENNSAVDPDTTYILLENP